MLYLNSVPSYPRYENLAVKSSQSFSIVCAVDDQFGIAKNGVIPWYSKQDLLFFKELTSKTSTDKSNAILMGRKTWDSLPKQPLTNRYNLILTLNPDFCTDSTESIRTFSDWEQSLAWSKIHANHTFIIGGGQIYQIALQDHRLSALYLTIVKQNFNCDLFFPWDPNKFSLQHTIKTWQEDANTFSIHKYIPKNLCI